MSELHKFLFEGLPVRGMLVRLTDGWQEALRRRESAGAFDAPLRRLLGDPGYRQAAGRLYPSLVGPMHSPEDGRGVLYAVAPVRQAKPHLTTAGATVSLGRVGEPAGREQAGPALEVKRRPIDQLQETAATRLAAAKKAA